MIVCDNACLFEINLEWKLLAASHLHGWKPGTTASHRKGGHCILATSRCCCIQGAMAGIGGGVLAMGL